VAATVAVVALVIIAALIVARLLARSVSRPILELVEATRRLSSGDLDHPVDVKARDEIALLVRSFNRMTEDLRASKENLRRAERTAAWRDVARRIAHEIKNPLTPVQLSVHRLRKRMTSTDPDSQRVITECLDLIHDEVANLRRLADEFSGFARMPPPQPVLSDLGELSRSVLDLYAGSNPRVEVGVEVRRGPVEARVDPGQYRQALGNLVKNALEVMPDGGRLRVSVERVLPPERPGARVSVTDTGPGLPVEVRGRVFEPYVTTKRGGSGLGLAIVHRIASDHGGSVDVETAEGRGTTFRLFFPESGGAAGAS
jgi:two-component system nitrogen regulation sensor histidine kinase NtrY